MKRKSSKVVVLISGILFMIGIVLIISSFVAGFSITDIWSWNGNSNLPAQSTEKTFESEEIQNIDISLGAAILKIEPSDNKNISVEVRQRTDSISFVNKNGTLEISESSFAYIWPTGKAASEVILKIPEEMELESSNIEIGAGTGNINLLNTRELDASIGAGVMNIENLETDNMVVECGMGSMDIKGRITGNASLECGMGTITIDIDNEEDAFNYSVDSGVGSISLNNKKIADFAGNNEIDNDADQNMEADCGVGDIKILTK